jgi:hypothetical protein
MGSGASARKKDAPVVDELMEDMRAYAEHQQIKALLGEYLRRVILRKPADPIAFLIEEISNSPFKPPAATVDQTAPEPTAPAAPTVQLALKLWSLDTVIGHLEADLDSAMLAPCARARAIDGAAELKVDETTIAEMVGSAAAGEANHSPIAANSSAGEHAGEAVVAEETAARRSRSSGDVITDGSETVGQIVARLGQGSMGSVFKMRDEDGTFCALKTVVFRRQGSSVCEQSREEALVAEIAICFAAGASPQITSVKRVIIPRPGQPNSLMLLYDYADGGDLATALHSGKTRSNGTVVQDYLGVLYLDSGAAKWPLASVMLQIFMGFRHLHDRGVIHQVCRVCRAHHSRPLLFPPPPPCSQDFKPSNLMLCSSGVVKITDYGES